MAKREDDGTISLAEANRRDRLTQSEIKQASRDAASIAKNAIDQAFHSPLDKPRGGRTQKNLRPTAE